jgi:hypothetical protein
VIGLSGIVHAMLVRFLWVVAVAVGCGKSGSASSSGSAATTGSAATSGSAKSCQVQADELAAMLRSPAFQLSPIGAVHGVALPIRTDVRGQALPEAPVLIIRSTETSFQGLIGGDVAAALESAREKADRLYMQIDRGTPFSRVVDAITLAKTAGFTTQSFVFTGAKLPGPPRSAADERLDKIVATQDENTLSELTKLVQEVISPCPELQRSYAALASAQDRWKHLAETTPAAVLACNCKVDVPSLRSVLWRVFAAQIEIPVITVEIVDDGPTLAAAASSTWDHVSKQLDPKATQLQFVVR